MSERTNASEGNTIQPLEGEAGIPSVATAVGTSMSPKLIMGLMVMVAIVGVAGTALVRNWTKPDPQAVAVKEAKKGPKAAAEGTGGKVFDVTKLPDGAPAAPEYKPAPPRDPNVPAIEITANESESADPIGVRATGQSAPRGATVTRAVLITPLDSSASLPLVSNTEQGQNNVAGRDEQTGEGSRADAARERLAGLQDTMKGLLGNINKITTPQAAAADPKALPPPGLGGQLTASRTPRVSAGMLGDRSLTMPKGTTFNCALKTRIVSEQSGFVSCQVLRNVFSDDGHVLLVERGSHMDGEYVAKFRQGQTRIFVVWSRVRTPNGVSIDIESPATGPLGEAGVDGYVNNHWIQRFGAAMLLTIIDDAVKISVAKQTGPASTVIAGDSGDTMSKVAEKMLDSTINIPPTIFKNQGEVVGIYVAKDVDFSSVYELRTAER